MPCPSAWSGSSRSCSPAPARRPSSLTSSSTACEFRSCTGRSAPRWGFFCTSFCSLRPSRTFSPWAKDKTGFWSMPCGIRWRGCSPRQEQQSPALTGQETGLSILRRVSGSRVDCPRLLSIPHRSCFVLSYFRVFVIHFVSFQLENGDRPRDDARATGAKVTGHGSPSRRITKARKYEDTKESRPKNNSDDDGTIPAKICDLGGSEARRFFGEPAGPDLESGIPH
jgi:hypothetical protein